MNKKKKILIISLITLLAIIIRLCFFDYACFDYKLFIEKWCNYLKDNGFNGLKTLKTDYNLPYLIILYLINCIPIKNIYLVKLLSCIFDFLLGKLTYDYIKHFTNNEKYSIIGYSIVLLLPTVIINSSVFAQCDSIYTFFALQSLLFLIKGKYHKSFIFLGIAFAFKLQFAFLLPVYVILYIKEKRYSLKYFLYIPLVNFIMCIPAYFVKISPLYTYKIYLFQAGEYMSTTAVNIVRLLFYHIYWVNYIVLIIAGIIFLLFAIKICRRKEKLSDKEIITLALIYVVGCYYFLPYMHERYLYMGDILCISWYIIHRKNIIVPISIQYCSLVGYIQYLFIKNIKVWSFLLYFVDIGIVILFITLYKLYKYYKKV